MKGEGRIRHTRREIVPVLSCTPQIPQTPYKWREIFVVDSVALGTGFPVTRCTPQIPQTPYNWREIFVVDSVALGTGFPVPRCTPQIPQTPYNWSEILFFFDSVALGFQCHVVHHKSHKAHTSGVRYLLSTVWHWEQGFLRGS